MHKTLVTFLTAAASAALPATAWASPLVTAAAPSPAASTSASSSSSTSSAYTVDDDRVQCPQSQYPTIQAAVLAAPPGATVVVCPGTYTGPVVVPKPVDLVALARGADARDSAPDPTRDAIVTNTGASGFDVAASGVRIAKFRVQGDGAATTYPDAGIYLRAGADRRIERNLIEDNNLGLYVEGRQDRLTVDRNAIQGNERDPNPTSIPSGGIFAAGGEATGGLVDTMISDNFFRSNEQFSINNGSGSDADFVVRGNRADRDGAFLVVGRTIDALVTGNVANDTAGSGIFAFGGNVGLVIERNTFDTGTGSGIALVAPTFGVTTPNRDVLVRMNEILNRTGNGVLLRGTVDSLVEKNDVTDNGLDGVRVDGQSSGNQIEKNKLSGNVEHDCHDDTVGAGTAGTANIWSKNKGVTENRPGLCDRGNSWGSAGE